MRKEVYGVVEIPILRTPYLQGFAQSYRREARHLGRLIHAASFCTGCLHMRNLYIQAKNNSDRKPFRHPVCSFAA